MKLLLYACYFKYITSYIIINMSFKDYYIAFHDPIWVLLLSIALFFPVRKFIWVLYVRKKQKTQQSVPDVEIKSLKRKATVTSILLCFVFSYVYVQQVFN